MRTRCLPSMNVFGLNPTSANIQKFYIPHFSQVPNIYSNSRLSLLNTKSVMYSRNCWLDVDFWNSDADILYIEDSLNWNEALNTTGNHYDYFSGFLKLYRVAHSDIALRGENSKNENHVHDIYYNFLLSDLVWVSPVLYGRLKSYLKKIYCKEMRNTIYNKMIVLPYPSFYKNTLNVELDESLRVNSKKPLKFLWNHRLVPNKNYKDFCAILCELHTKHANIAFEIHYVCAEPEENILKATPEQLRPFIKYKGFITNKKEYTKAIRECNITLATSKLESFGNSVMDAIGSGILLLNQDCNDALSFLLGSEYTFNKKDMVKIIVDTYTSKSLRQKIHAYNILGIKNILKVDPEVELADNFKKAVDLKMEKAPIKSRVLADALKALEKSSLTKPQLYEAIGWNVSKNPVNAHWSGYYYGLRREGVQTSFINNILYFHLTDKPVINEVQKNKKSVRGLFS